jgi:LPPG:FO 2-phospho-L-lactate transferase
MKIAALAGGVGGAKLVEGLSKVLKPKELTVIVNTGDDFIHLGLKICPDLDTVCYTLAGYANPATGWGRSQETWMALETLGILGGPTWFRIGDQDLGLHLERTRLMNEGCSLSQITGQFCAAFGVNVKVLPMSDDDVQTMVFTKECELQFQEYFVRQACRPQITGFRFEGIENAAPAPGVIRAIQTADLIVFCPSNPWVSLDPILSVSGIKRVLLDKAIIVGVSPIIGGTTLKGPAAKMYTELGISPSALAVANHYKDLLSHFVFDRIDASLDASIQNLGLKTKATNTIMKTLEEKIRLAKEVLEFGGC